MEHNRLGCINRDKNGCNNINKLFNNYTTTGTIPEVYKKSYKFEEKQKPPSVIIPTLYNCCSFSIKYMYKYTPIY